MQITNPNRVNDIVIINEIKIIIFIIYYSILGLCLKTTLNDLERCYKPITMATIKAVQPDYNGNQEDITVAANMGPALPDLQAE